MERGVRRFAFRVGWGRNERSRGLLKGRNQTQIDVNEKHYEEANDHEERDSSLDNLDDPLIRLIRKANDERRKMTAVV